MHPSTQNCMEHSGKEMQFENCSNDINIRYFSHILILPLAMLLL